MQIQDLMVKNVIVVSPTAGISEVARLLAEKRFHGLPVVENGKVIGIITETDFFTKDPPGLYLPSYIDILKKTKFKMGIGREQKKKFKELFNLQAKDIMSSPCQTILDTMPVRQAFDFFKNTHFITLPVINVKGELVGIITVSDILKLL